METKKRKRTDSAERIYKLLHRNPGLTTHEIMQHMPDLGAGTVQVAVSRMHQRGELERRGKKPEMSVTGKMIPHYTYHVKYNSRSKPKPKIKRKPPAKVPRVVEAPKPQPAAPSELQKMIDDWIEEPVVPPMEPPKVARAKPEPEGPTTPIAEREVLVLRHLTDIYKAMNLMTEQQDALIQVLKVTLADLAETKDELDRERQRRNWWDRLKDLFS